MSLNRVYGGIGLLGTIRNTERAFFGFYGEKGLSLPGVRRGLFSPKGGTIGGGVFVPVGRTEGETIRPPDREKNPQSLINKGFTGCRGNN